MKDATRARNQVWIVHLARNAALIHAQVNTLEQAAQYYGIALDASGSDPRLHLALADIYLQLGQPSKAARHLDSCYRLALRNNDSDALEVLEARGYRPTGDSE